MKHGYTGCIPCYILTVRKEYPYEQAPFHPSPGRLRHGPEPDPGRRLGPRAESADLSPAAALAAAEAEAEGDGGGYLLLAVDGKVCVYQDGALLMRTEIDVALLPAADRADLAVGIHAEDAFALAAYLEDFGA